MLSGDFMDYYNKDIVYFISYAKLPTNTSAGKLLDVVGLGLFINYRTGEIVDIACTLLTNEAKVFLKSILCDYNITTDKVDDIIDEIVFRFHGMSQKAITVALKAVYENYHNWRVEKLKTV